jgi:hypothetical protein
MYIFSFLRRCWFSKLMEIMLSERTEPMNFHYTMTIEQGSCRASYEIKFQ